MKPCDAPPQSTDPTDRSDLTDPTDRSDGSLIRGTHFRVGGMALFLGGYRRKGTAAEYRINPTSWVISRVSHVAGHSWVLRFPRQSGGMTSRYKA